MIARQDLKTDRAWQVAVAGVAALMLLAFYNGVFDLLKQWTKADYSHGFLVPPFAAFLLWRRRAMLPETIGYPDPWGLPFFAAAVALTVGAELNYAKRSPAGWRSSSAPPGSSRCSSAAGGG